MLPTWLRTKLRAVATRLIYRLDRFLTLPPLGQIAVVGVLTVVLIGAWAVVFRWMYPQSSEARSTVSALWWATTMFFDGGTMASAPAAQRLLALGATLTGVFAISFLTGAFASKMGDRLDELRSGRSPVEERGHILLLGFDAKAPMIARQLARSGQRLTLVVLSNEDSERVEVALRPARRVPGQRLKIVVRTGDPRLELNLLRVRAESARSIVVLPPSSLNDDASVEWTLSTLLAVRRVASEGFEGVVVVSARHASARAVLELAAEPDVAGPGALRTHVVASDDVIARVLAQSVREQGVYYALRELLSFEGSEIYVDPAPSALVGLQFDDAHERLHGGVLLGVIAADGTQVLSPSVAEARRIQRDDRIVVLATASRNYRLDGTLPPYRSLADEPPGANHRAERVVVWGWTRTLEHLLSELDVILPRDSQVRVLHEAPSSEMQSQLVQWRSRVRRIHVELDPRSAMDLVRSGDAALFGADSVVILGREDQSDPNGDASALASLLWLRHGLKQSPSPVKRVVTEVSDPHAAGKLAGSADDFLVSSDVVSMAITQAALDLSAVQVQRVLLDAGNVEVRLHPRARYVPDGAASFADVQRAARALGEIAMGLYPIEAPGADDSARARIERGETGEDEAMPVWLNPPRETEVPAHTRSLVVVLARVPASP